jgi:hypothetical protein
MRSRSGVALFWMLICTCSCGVQLDFRYLSFVCDGEEVPEDVVEDVGTGTRGEALKCGELYLCVVEAHELGGDIGACLGQVTFAEHALRDDVEACRTSYCSGAAEYLPGGQQFDPQKFTDCLLKSCRIEMVACATGHGAATCEDLADAWADLDAGQIPCELPAMDLCVIQEMMELSASESASAAELVHCMKVNYPTGVDDPQSCKAYCQSQ